MTANQSAYGYGAKAGASVYGDRVRREQSRTDSGTQREEQPIVYVYGDRICRKEAKQKQLYKKYGTAAGFADQGEAGGTVRKKRYKIVLENIINLIDSIEERRKQDVDAAKRSAIMRKKFIEHRRGFLLALFMLTFLTAFVLLGYHLFFGISTIYAENTVNYTADTVIAASGVELGDKLYSFSAEDAETRITFVCPYIRSVEVERSVPNRVSLALESDQAAYCVNVYGEKLVLSAGLRVLGDYDPAVNGHLPELCLPEIGYSVDGRVITFVDEKQDRFVREVLSGISESGLADRIGLADLRNPYDIVMHCDGMYLLEFGGEKDIAYKLKMAEKTLSDPDFRKDIPAEIDLGTVGEATIRYDHTIQLTSTAADS